MSINLRLLRINSPDVMSQYYAKHYLKSVLIFSFVGPYFAAFGMNTERYGIFPYSVRMRENTDQKNS